MKLTSAVVLCALAFAGADFAAAATPAPAGTACGAATTGAIIHDDGSVDTNYWLNGRADAAAVEKFTPTSYPNSFSNVCFQFITTNSNQSTLNFTILVFDDDGPDGSPGTLLGSKAATATQLHVATSSAAYPFPATFEMFDISDLNLSVTSGSVYIGATWDSRSTAFPNAKLGLDTSASTPLGDGYRRLTGTSAWDKIVNSTPAYRALFVRAVQTITLAPSLTKAFAPAAVAAQSPSTLTITLSNPVSTPAALTADLVDNLPAGLAVAQTPNASTTCTAGALSADPGASSVMLSSGASIPPNASCTISVDVVAASEGSYLNTIAAGALQTDQGSNANAAEATLTVSVPAGPPTVSKAFAPSTVAAGASTTLTITLSNGNTGAATLTAPLTDAFPAGIVLASLPSPASNCPNAQLSTTNTSFTLAAGAQIPATGSCTLSVRVRAAADATGGDHVNTIPAGALQTDLGNNAAAANATLTVQAPPTLAKAFSPSTIVRDETSTLTITLGNTNPAPLTLTAALTDTFPSGLVVASPANAATTCTGGAGVTTTSGSVTLAAGAQIPANGSCTVSVEVTSSTVQSYTNTLAAGALQTDLGSNGAPASAVLTVNSPTLPPEATVTPSSLALSARSDGTASATLTIANGAGRDPLTFSIAAHAAKAPLLVAHGLSKRTATPARAAGIGLSASAASGRAPAPWAPAGSVLFQLDDGSYERRVGLGNQDNDTESAAVWINRFAVNGALTIDSISILWPVQDVDTLAGRQANLVAYYDADADGDPGNAVRLGTDTLVTIAGEDAFETYATSFDVPGAGDVYVGFVDLWAADGTFSPFLRPAALDTTASQGMSYVSGASMPPTDVDVLANNDLTGTIDSFGLPGNWLIRATGSGGACSGPVATWLSVAPATGTVAGGSSTQVTVTADPAAGGLAPGTYSAELCVTTNDPAHALIVVPVSLSVTGCGAGDEIFCDGFDGTPAAQPLRDGGFEAAAGGEATWTSADTQAVDGATLFYRHTPEHPLPVRSGHAAAWFGGWGPGAVTQSFSQVVRLPAAGPLYLNFWLDREQPSGGRSTLTVSIDGRVVHAVDTAGTADRGFVPQSVAIDAFADAQPHVVRFEYEADGRGARGGNVFVDDVAIGRAPLADAAR
jgi:hypothetical protein